MTVRERYQVICLDPTIPMAAFCGYVTGSRTRVEAKAEAISHGSPDCEYIEVFDVMAHRGTVQCERLESDGQTFIPVCSRWR